MAMFIRDAFIASLFGIFGYASTACANSCANVDVIGTFDESGLRESEFGINAFGTFRVEGEADEGKQPYFNLAVVNCEKQRDDKGRVSLECTVMQAIVWPTPDKPDTDKPNCSLDLNSSAYSMKELQKGILTGIENSSSLCYNTMLTIDRNTKRVYMSFTRTTQECAKKEIEHRHVTVISVAPATSRNWKSAQFVSRPWFAPKSGHAANAAFMSTRPKKGFLLRIFDDRFGRISVRS
jgi:hypothetical protein